jgi:acyl-CoA synthetase (AMP-forming)/AMP-acid ligase II/acyl carrier protein
MGVLVQPSLVDQMERWAELTPDDVVYEFLDAGGGVATLTYRAVAHHAASLADRLVEHQPAGRDPVLLLHAPGLDYVVSVLACLRAGLPAVPAYPPGPTLRDADLQRLRWLVRDVRPHSVLADAWVTAGLAEAGLGDLAGRVVPTCDLGAQGPGGRGRRRPAAADPAVIQYTSGTTSAPRGVVVRFESLEHNLAAITRRFRLSRESSGLSWLPPYHDMGLVGGVLMPVYVGCRSRMMSPLDFLKRPHSWLRQMGETGATVSGGPNFAYDLCLRRRLAPDELARLDLSRWDVAFNGAEPVRWQTMAEFASRFAAAGFRRSAFYPCYGLAEATLMVAGDHWDGTVGDRGRASCGRPLADQELVIADPLRAVPAAEGSEGEVCLRGPSVTAGYWGADGGHELFVELDGRPFLRTGDLGCLVDGELVVTGRLKDVLVQRGRNHHAADVELAATAALPGLRPTSAAFAVDGGEQPLAVVVVEARRAAGAAEAIAAAVRARVLEETGLRLDEVVVVPPRTVPRTTSGKVQRGLCRERFLAGDYDAFVAPAGGQERPGPAPDGDGSAARRLSELVSGVFAAVCGVDLCGLEQSLLELGGDSVRAAEAGAALEDVLGVSLPPEAVLEHLTPNRLAGDLMARWLSGGRSAAELAVRLDEIESRAAAEARA